MAIPTDDINKTEAQQKLQRLLRKWKESGGATQDEFAKRIRRLINNHPKLKEYAYDHGWGDSDTAGNSDGGGGDRDRNRNRNRNRGGNAPKAPSGGGDLLPGKRGDHYSLVRFNGKMYVVYKIKLPGTDRFVKTSWRIQNPDKHGFDDKDGQPITKSQFKDLHHFGEASEIVRRRGGNKHPFKKWLEDIEATYGGSSLLHNKEAFGVLVSGFLESEDAAITEAKLRQTDWFQKRTASQREWEMVLTEKERDLRLRQTEDQVKTYLQDIYGPNVNWRKHVDPDQVNNWAKRIASGKWDDPAAAMAWWQQREERNARKIKGTAAWLSWQEEKREIRLIANRPEETFENVREQAINYLGYQWKPSAGKQGKPEFGTLWYWANALSSGKRSEHDYLSWLRKQKERQHAYLDPDETWMERASGYKNIGEEILGVPLSFNDRLFADFSKRDADGNPMEGKAMSSWDFERMVKDDPRYARSKDALTTASTVASQIAAVMGGGI